MAIESIIGIASGIITIGGFVVLIYNCVKKLDLKHLMSKLVDQNKPTKKHRRYLKTMNFLLKGHPIKKEYIDSFTLKNRRAEAVFKEICEQNGIEPLPETCIKILGYDMKEFRKEYQSRKGQNKVVSQEEKPSNPAPEPAPSSDQGQTVYLSEILRERYPEACANLLRILEKHHVEHAFLKGTKDIWCRDYMPVRLESGKLIQFRYEPSYLTEDSKYEAIRTDVRDVCKLNNIKPRESDINLDGGNVLICDGRAIISDRVFPENPDRDKQSLKKELAQLLECEIIIIPTIHGDLTGHADGMVRFVNKNTLLGNDRAKEYRYWTTGIEKVLAAYDLNYIDVPFFEPKRDSKHPYSAIGIYVNFLELNDLIIAPIFGAEMDKDAIAVLQKAFPHKQIETINYSDVALDGGLLNCTTWVI